MGCDTERLLPLCHHTLPELVKFQAVKTGVEPVGTLLERVLVAGARRCKLNTSDLSSGVLLHQNKKVRVSEMFFAVVVLLMPKQPGSFDYIST